MDSINNHYAPVTYPNNKCCIIYGHVINGLGDIACAMKIAKWVSKELKSMKSFSASLRKVFDTEKK
jgi:hypothetical protein